MSIKSFLFSKYALWKVKKELERHARAAFYQNSFLLHWLQENKNSQFGKEHHFEIVKEIADYAAQVPIRNYEDFLPYIERIKRGDSNILTKKNPKYLLLTSGTTSGSKYIPITHAGIQQQINAALKVLCFYAANIGNASFINHKMIFLQGSPALDHSQAIPSGRLSGVVYHHVPKFFHQNKLPSYEVNIIEDWQIKIDKIVEETHREDISILGGIPPWCLQYFEKLLEKSKKQNLKDLFPNLAMYIHGGLDFSNYKENIGRVLGASVPCLQTFPASEGFFALQDRLGAEDMLLLLNQGIYYEFKPYPVENSPTVSIDKVQINRRYELIITNNSGLYRYAIGDLIEFTSLSPYRIKVVGRTTQFISAFGEHVIAYEVERALEKASESLAMKVMDFYVYASVEEKQYVWQIEFQHTYSEENISLLEMKIDSYLKEYNKYYAHLLNGRIIKSCKIIALESGSFQLYRTQNGRLGGQNKILRLGMSPLIT